MLFIQRSESIVSSKNRHYIKYYVAFDMLRQLLKSFFLTLARLNLIDYLLNLIVVVVVVVVVFSFQRHK